MDQATTWTGKLSLTEFAVRLCPNLHRRFIRATMIGARMKAVPMRALMARLPSCTDELVTTALARFHAKQGAEAAALEAGATLLTRGLARADEIERDAHKAAVHEADRQLRAMYKKQAAALWRRVSRKIVQAIADGELRFTGRHGELLDDPIPAHLAGSLQVDARTVSLPPDGDDRGMVWRDVFVSCTPPKRKGGNREYSDDALVAEGVRRVECGQAKSARDAAEAMDREKLIKGAEASRAKRLAGKINKALEAAKG